MSDPLCALPNWQWVVPTRHVANEKDYVPEAATTEPILVDEVLISDSGVSCALET